MSECNAPEDSSSGYLIATASDEQSSSSSESRSSETQQLSGFGVGFSGITSAESAFKPKISSIDSDDKTLPIDLNGDKERTATVAQLPAMDVQHGMIEVAEPPSPPSDEISSMEVSPAMEIEKSAAHETIGQPSGTKSLEQLAIPVDVAIKNPLDEVPLPSPTDRKNFAAFENGIIKVPDLRHVHYKTESCDCLQIIDEGGVKNPHQPQTRRIEKITGIFFYTISIDMPEFSRGDISVMIKDNCKLSIHAKRDINTEYGNECHEFQKILKIPEDANASTLEANFQGDGKLVVQLGRKRAQVSEKTK